MWPALKQRLWILFHEGGDRDVSDGPLLNSRKDARSEARQGWNQREIKA